MRSLKYMRDSQAQLDYVNEEKDKRARSKSPIGPTGRGDVELISYIDAMYKKKVVEPIYNGVSFKIQSII